MRLVAVLLLFVSWSACVVDDDGADLAMVDQAGGPSPRELCQASYRRSVYDKATGTYRLVPNDRLDDIVAACPAFANALRWTVPDATPFVYRLWSEPRKQGLRTRYQQYLARADVGATVPRHAGADRTATLLLSEDQAFDLFAVNAAHALALEVNGDVPWSLLDFPESNLLALFDSEQFVTPVIPGPSVDGNPPWPWGSYLLPQWRAGGYVDRPQDGYRFVRGTRSTSGRDLVASTPEQTLANLSLWTAQNVEHGWGIPITPDPLDLAGRLRASPSTGGRGTAIVGGIGCHTTRDLLVDLARSVNLPLSSVYHPSRATPPWISSIGHGAAAFRWDSTAMRVLEHADDLNAIGLYPDAGFAPLDTSAAHARALFDALWPTTGELASFGFAAQAWPERIYVGDARVEAAAGIGRINQQAHRTLGFVVGGFGDETDTGSLRWQAYVNERIARLGSPLAPALGTTGTPLLIDSYCASRAPGGAITAPLIAWFRATYPMLAATDAQAQARLVQLEALVTGGGGCAAIATARAAYATTPAGATWRD